ncbi:MAG: class I SAM-dependent methyltransferase [Bacteroidota bacterium]
MSLAFWKTNSLVQSTIRKIWLWDARQKVKKIIPFLRPNEKILEVGTGLGTVSYLLLDKGYQVQGLDVENYCFFPEIDVEVYDGRQFPYPEQSFDTVLILTVLHHTKDPEAILGEAARVGKKMIIIEDIYRNVFQKYLTFGVDSIVNWEFWGHPHSNKTDQEWKKTFQSLGLALKSSYTYPFVGLFRQVLYLLEKK